MKGHINSLTVYLLSWILSGLYVVVSDGLCVVTEGDIVDTLVDDFVVVLIGIWYNGRVFFFFFITILQHMSNLLLQHLLLKGQVPYRLVHVK